MLANTCLPTILVCSRIISFAPPVKLYYVGVFAFVLGLYWARVCTVTFVAFVMNKNENEIQIDLSLVSHVPVKG